ncbi:Rv0361 family membrane protein [Streptomyces sp. NPDC002446]
MSHQPGQGTPPWPPQGSQPPAVPPGDPRFPRQSAGRRKKWWYLGAAAALLAAAGGVTAYLLVDRGESEQSRIEKVVADFALAVDRGDTPKMISLLCQEEASGIADNDGDPGDDDRDTQSKPIPITTSEVRITGDTASAVVTRPALKPAAVYLRKEKGAWRMCAPAAKSHREPSGRASASSG